MSKKGLYQPQIADEHIRKLYWMAKRQGVRMTQLLNLIVAVAIEELESAGEICDEAPEKVVVAKSKKSGIHRRGIAADAQPAQPRRKNHERSRIYHAHALCQRRQCREV